jgi:Uma2 family endonuclease
MEMETITLPSPPVATAERTRSEQEWQDLARLPTELPYSDGEPMESSWHVDNSSLFKASYIAAAAQQGHSNDVFIGTNMFVYYSLLQVRNQDYKGPDIFIVKNVDGSRSRLYWATWDEDGRFPDVIVELLSPSTEENDLGFKKTLYEQTFKTPEYFCADADVERLLGWRLSKRTKKYQPIQPDERGWLWSAQLELWLGRWHGRYMNDERTWLRLYHPDGSLVLLPEEAERQRAEAEHQRAEHAEQRAEIEYKRAERATHRIAELQAELERLRGNGGTY